MHESKIFGLTVRSFSACFIIVVCVSVLGFLTVQTGNDQNLMLFGTSALSFLFGKAAGEQETKKTTPPSTPNEKPVPIHHAP